jgi:hypothetical protein
MKKEKPKATETKAIDPQGAERYTALLADAKKYPLLSVHVFGGVRYRVDSVMLHNDGVAVEFVRVG